MSSEAKIKSSNKSKHKHRLQDVFGGSSSSNSQQQGHYHYCSSTPAKAKGRRSMSTMAMQAINSTNAVAIITNKSFTDLAGTSVDSNNNLNGYEDEFDEDFMLDKFGITLAGGNNSNTNTNKVKSRSTVNNSNNSSNSGSESNNNNNINGTNKSNSPNYSITTDDIEVFNRLNEQDLFVDNSRWLSEKPISVLQLDLADRAVLKIAGTWC